MVQSIHQEPTQLFLMEQEISHLRLTLPAPLSLNKLTIDKPAGIALTFAGTQSIINVADNLSLFAGTLNDNGNTINIAKNVYNSGIT